MDNLTELRRQKIQGVVSTGNSTITPLAGGATFTGDWVDVLDYGIVYVNTVTDEDSADNGLVVQHSSDGTNIDFTDEYTVIADIPVCTPIVPHTRYVRVAYTNGSVAQTVFRLQTILKGIGIPTCVKYYDASNSTETPLGISGVFTGEWVSTKGFGQAIVSVLTDEDSAAQGLKIETSDDGITSDHSHTFTVAANDPNGHHYASTLESNYMRIEYTNGVIAQTSFKLKTTLFVNAVEAGHVHSLDYAIDDDHPAEIVRNVNVAQQPSGTYVNIGATTGGNLKVSVEEFDDAANPVRTNLEGGGYVTVGTTAVALTFAGTTDTVHIESKITNTGTVWIGKSNVTSAGANALASLQAGESIDLRYDDSTNALYAVSDTAAQSVLKGALL